MKIRMFAVAAFALLGFAASVPSLSQTSHHKPRRHHAATAGQYVDRSSTRTNRYVNHTSKNINHYFQHAPHHIKHSLKQTSKNINHTFQGK